MINVLLVEDDDIDAEAVMRGFSKHHIGNEVERVRDGIEALEVLRGTGGSPPLQKPYIILLDINMPRMNGLELLREIRDDHDLHDAVVFMLSTSESEQDKRTAYSLNVAGYILKSDAGPSFLKAASLLGEYMIAVTLPE